MLSNACQNAIRSVLYLAMFSDKEKKIGVKPLAENLEIPQPFLAKVLQNLNKADIVSSVKGPYGGFYLDKTSTKTVWDIIICIDGTKKFDNCFLGLSKCSDESPCPVHFSVKPFKEKIMSDFKEKTIFEFANEIKNSNKVISLKDFDVLND
jgi:Rrf2 family protein